MVDTPPSERRRSRSQSWPADVYTYDLVLGGRRGDQLPRTDEGGSTMLPPSRHACKVLRLPMSASWIFVFTLRPTSNRRARFF